jgi:nitric oxide reductase NorE protein
VTVTASPPRERRIPGEAGTWVFLFGDMLVFGVFFGTFLLARAGQPELFDRARETLHIGVGLADTLVLRAVSAAMGLGLVFVGLKVGEYVSLGVAGHGPGAHEFYLYYFILTGLHLFHVAIGPTVLAAVATQLRRPLLSPGRTALIEGGACFWHLVDLLWIFLFALLYLVS